MSNLREASSLIAIDWGSTSFRGYLLSKDGVVLDTIRHPSGVTSIEHSFQHTLEQLIGHWPQHSIVACGMIGSSLGLVETEYCQTPVSHQTIGQNLVNVTALVDRPMYIVPGICTHTGSLRDVIRGEESIALGISSIVEESRITVCMPGTHSKWLRIQDNSITHFETYVTGELFATLPQMPLLSNSMLKHQHNSDAFVAGLMQTLQHHSLLHNLFSLRCRILDNSLSTDEGYSYASGLLIGTEILQAPIEGNHIVLASDGILSTLYQEAMRIIHPQLSVSVISAEQALIKEAVIMWRNYVN